jgi:hypothetical protein
MYHYYDRSDLKRMPELVQLAQQASSSYFSFEKDVYHGAENVLGHATQALKAFESEKEQNTESTDTSVPKCFCGSEI